MRVEHPAIDACWRRIGVSGDRSCPELRTHIHCRNCPVYATAARALLDSTPSAEVLEAATRHFAQNPRLEDKDAQWAEARSVIVFRLHGEWFALPTALCLEVSDLKPIHSLPHRRSAVLLGLANIRGELRICLSLADLLGVAVQAQPKRARRGAIVPRLLVVRTDSGPVVFPVDEVQGVRRFAPRELQDVPATLAKAQARYTQALLRADEQWVGVLDAQLLLRSVERSLV